MQDAAPAPGTHVRGQIKWFDPGRGFGFLTEEGGGAGRAPDGGAPGSDILLHLNVLRNFGQGSVAEGSWIEAIVIVTPRGRQVAEVLRIDPPPEVAAAPIPDLDGLDAVQLDRLPLMAARVKWFDRIKGFGFANIFGRRGDVFLHVEVLRHSGFADLTIGEAIGIRVVEGPRGLMAAQITSWDRGTEQGAPSLVETGVGAQVQDIKDFITHVAE